jgi:hypothetical protein
MASMKKAVLHSFDSNNYAATVEISGSGRAYLQGVKVARNIPAGEMVTGRNVLVNFIDEHNARDAAVIAVY